MRKQHGPDLKRVTPKIERCPACRSTGIYQGLHHEMDCATCEGAGWVVAGTGEVIPEDRRALTLCRKIREMELQSRAAAAPPREVWNNRRGPHGSHRTGD